jgi:hypothetical protein
LDDQCTPTRAFAGRPAAMRKVGIAVTFRSGAELLAKRCRKLKWSTPASPTHPDERLGVRSSTVCAPAAGVGRKKGAATPAAKRNDRISALRLPAGRTGTRKR